MSDSYSRPLDSGDGALAARPLDGLLTLQDRWGILPKVLSRHEGVGALAPDPHVVDIVTRVLVQCYAAYLVRDPSQLWSLSAVETAAMLLSGSLRATPTVRAFYGWLLPMLPRFARAPSAAHPLRPLDALPDLELSSIRPMADVMVDMVGRAPAFDVTEAWQTRISRSRATWLDEQLRHIVSQHRFDWLDAAHDADPAYEAKEQEWREEVRRGEQEWLAMGASAPASPPPHPPLTRFL